MQPRKAALLVAVTSAALFATRTIGTLWPAVFEAREVALISLLVHLGATLALLLFFAAFYGFHAREDQPALRLAAGVAAVGSGVVALLHAKYIYVALGGGPVRGFLGLRLFDAIAPLFGTVTAVLFFVALLRETRRGESRWLGRPATIALCGSAAFAAIQALVLLNYLDSGVFRWIQDFPWRVMVVTLPVLVAGYLATLWFFVAYYRGPPRATRRGAA